MVAFVFSSGYTQRRRVQRAASHQRDGGDEEERLVRVVERVAVKRGLRFQDVSTGPLFGIEAWVGEDKVGYASGYLVPSVKRFHLESLKTKKVASAKGSLMEPTAAKLLVLLLLARAAEKGAEAVYALAIDDGDEQHRRLVKYVQRMGGIVVRKVGGRLKDVPDRLVWGGQGTILRASLEDLFHKWKPVLKQGE